MSAVAVSLNVKGSSLSKLRTAEYEIEGQVLFVLLSQLDNIFLTFHQVVLVLRTQHSWWRNSITATLVLANQLSIDSLKIMVGKGKQGFEIIIMLRFLPFSLPRLLKSRIKSTCYFHKLFGERQAATLLFRWKSRLRRRDVHIPLPFRGSAGLDKSHEPSRSSCFCQHRPPFCLRHWKRQKTVRIWHLIC